MSDLPAPLVAAHVDLRSFEYMPLSVARTRDSRFAAVVSGDGFRAGVLLWCASWHQVPAASLPDDDVELAALAGYGRVLREWLTVKEDALYGWVKCSDGRWYHPVVAEKAIEAWDAKAMQAWRLESDRVRKENKKREGAGLGELALPEKPAERSGAGVAGIPSESTDLSAGNDRVSIGIPAENALKGTEQKGIENLSSCGSGARPRTDAETEATEPAVTDPVRDIVQRFLDLRSECWPQESRFPAPTLTLNRQAADFLAQGAPLDLVIEVIEREMRGAAAGGKSATQSLLAFKHSLPSAIRAHRERISIHVEHVDIGAGDRPECGRRRRTVGPLARAVLAGNLDPDAGPAGLH